MTPAGLGLHPRASATIRSKGRECVLKHPSGKTKQPLTASVHVKPTLTPPSGALRRERLEGQNWVWQERVRVHTAAVTGNRGYILNLNLSRL